MKKEFQDIITEYLGVEPIMINSSLVSAQNRVRLYWTNIPNVAQPKDRNIILRDVLETDTEEKFDLSDKAVDYMKRHRNGKPRFEYHKNPLDGKASCIVAVQYKGVPYGVLEKPCTLRTTQERVDSECHHVATADDINGHDCIKRVYADSGKSPTLNACTGGNREPKVLVEDNIVLEPKYRKLTPLECERLQTVPDNYTSSVSNSQRYKMLGNGWTVEVIKHIFKQMEK
jgi:site-specific DNA-cytosine methylase